MTIIRDDGEERQTRVDRMIGEFRAAQARRLANAPVANGGDATTVVQRDADSQAPVASSAAAPPPSR